MIAIVLPTKSCTAHQGHGDLGVDQHGVPIRPDVLIELVVRHTTVHTGGAQPHPARQVNDIAVITHDQQVTRTSWQQVFHLESCDCE